MRHAILLVLCFALVTPTIGQVPYRRCWCSYVEMGNVTEDNDQFIRFIDSTADFKILFDSSEDHLCWETDLHLGDDTDVDTFLFIRNGDANYPFLAYDASLNKMAWSNDGTTWNYFGDAAGAAGSDTQVQYNDSGSLAGDAGMVYNAADDELTVDGAIEIGSVGTAYPLNVDDNVSGVSMWTSGSININRTPNSNYDALYIYGDSRFQGATSTGGTLLRMDKNFNGAATSSYMHDINTNDQRATGNAVITSLDINQYAYDTNYVSGNIYHRGIQIGMRNANDVDFDYYRQRAIEINTGTSSGQDGNVTVATGVLHQLSGGGEGTISLGRGYYTYPYVTNASGVVSDYYGLQMGTGNHTGTINNIYSVHIGDMTYAASSNYAMYIQRGDDTNAGAQRQNVYFQGGEWNSGHLQLNSGHVYADDGGEVLLKDGAPASASDWDLKVSATEVVTDDCFRIGGESGPEWCSGTSPPGTCSPGDLYSDTDGDGTTNCGGGTDECYFAVCRASNNWYYPAD